MILANGAKQLVVHDAFDTMVSDGLTSIWFTPITNIGAVLDGAEITTFLAPAVICASAVFKSVKIPVQSSTIVAPTSSHFKCSGLRSALTLTWFPSTTRFPFSTATLPL